MNIRKNIDYTDLYEALDALMAQHLPQMELYCGIGKAVCRRTEKGAAVMASEYLNKNYPDVKGFSPRSLRRMRDFYRTYEGHPLLLSRAMKLGWTLNVVIMEADLSVELREWYMKAAEQFGWSKSELMRNIASDAHQHIVCDTEDIVYEIVGLEDVQMESMVDMVIISRNITYQFMKTARLWRNIWHYNVRLWNNVQWEIFARIPLIFMRC